MVDLNTQAQPAPDNVHNLLYPTYRLTEIVGTAQGSVDEVISNGLTRAATTLHSLDWFEVVQIRGSIQVDAALDEWIGLSARAGLQEDIVRAQMAADGRTGALEATAALAANIDNPLLHCQLFSTLPPRGPM